MNVRMPVQQIVALALATAFLLVAAGCLVTSSKKTEESGVRVSQVTLDQIRPGETTEGWLVAAVGEPTTKREAGDGTAILRYEYVTTTSSGGTVFLLFAGGSKKKESSTVIFEVKDGVIQRYWTEATA